MRRLEGLSRREREIMNIIFSARKATAGEVRARMIDPPSYSAVRATLRILEDKGLLKHEEEGRRYVYRSALRRDAAARSAMQQLLTTFYEGSVADAVLALLDRPDLEISSDDLDRMMRLIARAREEGR